MELSVAHTTAHEGGLLIDLAAPLARERLLQAVLEVVGHRGRGHFLAVVPSATVEFVRHVRADGKLKSVEKERRGVVAHDATRANSLAPSLREGIVILQEEVAVGDARRDAVLQSGISSHRILALQRRKGCTERVAPHGPFHDRVDMIKCDVVVDGGMNCRQWFTDCRVPLRGICSELPPQAGHCCSLALRPFCQRDF